MREGKERYTTTASTERQAQPRAAEGEAHHGGFLGPCGMKHKMGDTSVPSPYLRGQEEAHNQHGSQGAVGLTMVRRTALDARGINESWIDVPRVHAREAPKRGLDPLLSRLLHPDEEGRSHGWMRPQRELTLHAEEVAMGDPKSLKGRQKADVFVLRFFV